MGTPEKRPNYRVAGIAALAGGLCVVAACLRHVLRALDSRVTIGKLGAVHASPEPLFFVAVGAGVVGVVLGAVLARLGWRWLRWSKDDA